MTVGYAVTFEFDTRAPLTHRGTVVASSGATCVARAVREAQKVLQAGQLVVVELRAAGALGCGGRRQ